MTQVISQRPACRPFRSATERWDISRVLTKTQGEIEATICEGISRFQQEYMGRGPKKIRAHLISDLLVIRLQGVLTSAEQQLAKTLSSEKGRDLLKEVRTHLIETARPLLGAMIQEATGVKVLSLHYDISTVTGEEVVLFTLERSPDCRQTANRTGVQNQLSCSCRKTRRRATWQYQGPVDK